MITPTTQAIADNIVAQLESAIDQATPFLPKAFQRVLAKALAGVFILLWKYAGLSLQQQFIRHATIEPTEVNGKIIRPLVEWGVVTGEGTPNPGVAAELVIEVTVLTQVGDLAAFSQLVRAETGVIYHTVAAVALDAATVQVTVKAVSDQDGNSGVGAIGNLDPGDVLTFANPLPNVASEATVVSTSVLGVDAEDPEHYRARVLARSQAKPQGGAYADYRVWGEGVAGVANIYPYTGDPCEIDVYVECTTDLDPDGIPDQTLLDAVADAIDLDQSGLATNRPAGAGVNVLPISRTAFDVVVIGLSADDSVQAVIEDGLAEFFLQREPFIVGLSVLPRLDRITQGAIGGLVNELVNAEGGTVATVELQVDGVTLTGYTLGAGEKAKLGTVTYQ